ncbi:MAG: ABC transporter permease [Phycisphaeraceae bacterium]
MSSGTIQDPREEAALAQPALATPPMSLPRRILGEMLGRWGARLGMIWIGGMFLLAVFSPFIANSHPYLLILKDGSWSSPLLRHLTPQDVILLVALFMFIVMWFMRRTPLGRKIQIYFITLAVVALISFIFVRPPGLIVYEKYRELSSAGEVSFVLNAPIPYSPHDRLRDIKDARLAAPTTEHWMGTDNFSADLMSKLIHATRIALAVGFIATGIAVVIGIIIGGIMGYFAGAMDLLGMRLVEMFEAIPTLFLLIAIAAVIPERNIYIMMTIIGLTGWTGYARFVRAEFLKLRHQDFVLAAKACGLPLHSILFKHMLPNGVAPVLVGASFGIAGAILLESTLSFLGLGLGPGEPSWGQLLNQTLGAGGRYLWIIVYPGLAIFLTVFAYNLIGESLRDAIDPHTKRIKRQGG